MFKVYGLLNSETSIKIISEFPIINMALEAIYVWFPISNNK